MELLIAMFAIGASFFGVAGISAVAFGAAAGRGERNRPSLPTATSARLTELGFAWDRKSALFRVTLPDRTTVAFRTRAGRKGDVAVTWHGFGVAVPSGTLALAHTPSAMDRRSVNIGAPTF